MKFLILTATIINSLENSKVYIASAKIVAKDTTLVPIADHTNRYGFQVCLFTET